MTNQDLVNWFITRAEECENRHDPEQLNQAIWYREAAQLVKDMDGVMLLTMAGPSLYVH